MSFSIDNHNEESKKTEGSRLSAASSTLRKFTIDRFVLAHFFLLFVVSFVIGILFLHSTIALWDWQTNEAALLTTLESFTHSFDLNNKHVKSNSDTNAVLTISFNENTTFTTAVT